MADKNSGNQPSTKEAQEKTFSEAVRLVNAEIEAVRKRLEDISQAEETDPVLVEGETSTGCYAKVMANPSKIADIMLEDSYHIWSILENDDELCCTWLDIADMVGLASVSNVDINPRAKH